MFFLRRPESCFDFFFRFLLINLNIIELKSLILIKFKFLENKTDLVYSLIIIFIWLTLVFIRFLMKKDFINILKVIIDVLKIYFRKKL